MSQVSDFMCIGVVATALALPALAQAPIPNVSPQAAALTIVHNNEAIPVAAAAASGVGAAHASKAYREPVELPGLERRPDGGYRFEGVNFTARIAPNGSVTFRDRYIGVRHKMRALPQPSPDAAGMSNVGVANGVRNPVTSPWLSQQINLDWQGWLMHKLGGNDPYQSERRWFMERTRELRDDLAEQVEHEELDLALAHVWNGASVNLVERKRATFALWRDTTQDERGAAARAYIEQYVRARCPQGSGCAFQSGELARLNEGQPSAARFDPYRRAIARASDSPRPRPVPAGTGKLEETRPPSPAPTASQPRSAPLKRVQPQR